MRKESKVDWPIISDISSIDPDWWTTVMKQTAPMNYIFDKNLSDEEDFTIRSMVYIMKNSGLEEIEYVFDGSLHLDRVRSIHELLNSKDKEMNLKGVSALKEFVAEFNTDMNEDN